MALHPEIQKKAQKELDAVTEGTRMPTFEDREKLPYIDCILQECLRWNPVTPLSLTHTAVEDDVYMGMRIPKGTHIVPNVWYESYRTHFLKTLNGISRAMLHDETIYPDPFAFNPDRFLQKGASAANDSNVLNPYPTEAFGFGRR